MPTIKGLLQAILYDLSLPFHGLDEQELRLTLTDFLLGKYAGGGRTVLVIDEAHNLAVPLLEELRMLSNLEGESDKLFQIVLAGHPRLLQLIRSPELETLSQRVGARAVLVPLNDEETAAFIQYQLDTAGVDCDRVFTYEAICAVHELTNGIPRLISQLADHALLRAYVTEMRRVDRATVIAAKTDLEQSTEQRKNGSAPANYTPRILETDCMDEDELAIHETGETFIACTEFEGSLESLQISTNRFGETTQPSAGIISEIGDAEISPAPRRDNFIEEVVVDPYAMMDAARNASTAARQMQAVARKSAMAGKVTAPAISSEQRTVTPPPLGVYDESSSKVASSATTGTDLVAPEALFVESVDNAAVHEVGAGMNSSANEVTDPPILVIENRQQRIGGQIGRVDTPKQPGSANRGYRRLFTHARKS
jgi:hypothetical protein